MALVLVLDAGYVAVRLFTALTGARSSFEEAGAALAGGRLDEAEVRLTEALSQAEAARSTGKHPSSMLISLLPGVSDDVEAIGALSEAAAEGARAGLEVVDAGRAAGTGDSLIGSIYADGRIKFDAVERMTPFLARAEEELISARRILERAPEPSVGRIRDAVESAEAKVTSAAAGARSSRIALHALPGLFGKDSTKRYLLAFQSQSEARATGGLIGMLGTLEISDGRLGLTSLTPTSWLVDSKFKPISAPPWFEKRYAPLSSLREFPQTNFSPSFPNVSEVLLKMFEKVKGPHLDGVVAMDPYTLKALLPATGPVPVRGLDYPVTADSVTNLLLRDAYLKYTPAQQDRRLASLVRGFWDKVRLGQFAPAPFVSGLAESVQTGHFLMYSRDGEDQRALRSIDAAGALPRHASNPQMIYHNNAAYTKVDYFVERSIDTIVEFDQQGAAHVTATAVVTNNAPPGIETTLTGPNVEGDDPGLNRMFLNFLLPMGAEFDSFSLNGRRAEAFKAKEGPFPVIWQVVEIPSGARAAVEVSYTVPEAVDLQGDQALYTMNLLAQSTVTPDRYSVSVVAPYGYSAEIEGSEPDVPDRIRGRLDRDLSIRVELRHI